MLTAGHFGAVQSEQQLKAGGTCTSTSYGGLQLGTCMYLLVFSVIGSLPSHAIIAEQIAQIVFADLVSPAWIQQGCVVFDVIGT
jgi:hypothetical protein